MAQLCGFYLTRGHGTPSVEAAMNLGPLGVRIRQVQVQFKDAPVDDPIPQVVRLGSPKHEQEGVCVRSYVRSFVEKTRQRIEPSAELS